MRFLGHLYYLDLLQGYGGTGLKLLAPRYFLWVDLGDIRMTFLNWSDVDPFNVSASFVSLCLCG